MNDEKCEGTPPGVSGPLAESAAVNDQGPTSDVELLRAAMSDDIEAYIELYGRFKEELGRFVRSITGSSYDVHDVLADTFIDVYETIQGYDPRGFNLRAYLYKAAGRKALKVKERKGMEVASDMASDVIEDALWEDRNALSDEFEREFRSQKRREALEEGRGKSSTS